MIRFVLYLTGLLYLRSVFFDYVYDDIQLLLLNPGMQSWKAIPGFFTHTFWSFLEIPRGIDFYRPLVMLTLALVHHFLGPAPGWFHLITVAIHVLAAYLVYRLAYETVEDKTVAGIAAGLFSLHPTKVESVAWISGISDSLSAVFFLASMVAYFQWKKSGLSKKRAISAGLLVLALFSKEAAIFAPVLIAIYEFSATRTSFIGRCKMVLQSVWPYAAASCLVLMTRAVLVKNSGVQIAGKIRLIPTVLSAPHAILWYLGKQLWPIGLSIHYPVNIIRQPSITGFVIPFCLVVALGAFVIALIRGNSIGVFYFSWFVIMLAPVILYQDLLLVHDRYIYFASVATSVGFAWLLVQTVRLSIVLEALVTLAAFGLMAACTFNYESYWDNDIKLFTRAQQIAPQNPNVADYLATVYVNQLDFSRAEDVAQALIRNSEVTAEGWLLLGTVKSSEGKLDEARTAMQTAVQLSTRNRFLPNIELADVDMRMGNNAEAARIYQQEITIYPKIAFLHGQLATVLDRLGRGNDAKREWELQKSLTQN